jgi:hypothetical protein
MRAQTGTAARLFPVGAIVFAAAATTRFISPPYDLGSSERGMHMGYHMPLRHRNGVHCDPVRAWRLR